MPTHGRRGMLRALLQAAPSGRVHEEPPARRRPPGAIPEAQFLLGCTGCLACVEACPQRAIHTLAAAVTPGAGTPVMVPDARPCSMCEGFPCVAACEDGVLLPFDEPAWPLGTVIVDPTRCLPFLGPECGACTGVCPAGVEALTLVRGRPHIDEERCVGCGLCIDACVTRPAALELLPLQ